MSGPPGTVRRTAVARVGPFRKYELIVVIPVIALSLWLPWRYRAGNARAAYRPEWGGSRLVESLVWLVPAALGRPLVWTSSHRLDPYRPLASDRPPLQVQAVSLDWNWLFIYLPLGIATLIQLVFPARMPLTLRLTSDKVISAFFVPRLGSQIYTMVGMETPLNLMADSTGRYLGENSQFRGAGFADMRFEAMATTNDDFARWGDKAPQTLDAERFVALERPSARVPVEHFSRVSPGLFGSIRAKYRTEPRDTLPDEP